MRSCTKVPGASLDRAPAGAGPRGVESLAPAEPLAPVEPLAPAEPLAPIEPLARVAAAPAVGRDVGVAPAGSAGRPRSMGATEK